MKKKDKYWELMFYMAVNHVRNGWHKELHFEQDDEDDDVTCVQKMLVHLTLMLLQVDGGIYMDTEGEEPKEETSLPWSEVSENLRAWGVKPDAILKLYRDAEQNYSARFN